MEIAIVMLGVFVLGLGWWLSRLVLVQGELNRRIHALQTERDTALSEHTRIGDQCVRIQSELADAVSKGEESSKRVVELSVEMAEIKARLDGAEKRYQDLVNDEKRLVESFEAIGGKSLRANQEALSKFLTERLKDADSLSQGELDKRKLAIEALIKPISETLGKTQEQLVQLDERVKASGESSSSLRNETAKLAKALSKPEVRGQYGEIQLKRVAELAGMRDYCDFNEQSTTRDSEGNPLRPDMVVTLPNDRVIAVDAKANFSAYMDAVHAETDQERDDHLKRFAKHTTEQAKQLGGKKYWALFDRSPDFVVMFVPGDHFLDAALSKNNSLIEDAAQWNVILASPSTLIGLLRAVAVGWREQALTEQAAALFELGKELHDRAATAFEHAGKLGDSIRMSVDRYNRLVGSIDSRMMPTLRKFEEAGAKSTKGLVEPKTVSGDTRELVSGQGLLEGVDGSETR